MVSPRQLVGLLLEQETVDGSVAEKDLEVARQRGNQPESGLLRDADPAGPHLGRSRGGQDQQRPGPDGHGDHHPSCMASGWGSPVSAARAVATSWVVART